jgi:hypothetical protein
MAGTGLATRLIPPRIASSKDFDAAAYAHWLTNRNIGGFARPLALYVHLPFCDTVCFYCACNKIITKQPAHSAKYVDYLEREIDLVARRMPGDRRVSRMHWGGGTPTFLRPPSSPASWARSARNSTSTRGRDRDRARPAQVSARARRSSRSWASTA